MPTANPYVGPRPFEAGQPLFGRDRELAELRYLLTAQRIVLLYSPSGAGKSSLVNAGLLPRLAERFDIWGPTRVNSAPGGAVTNRYAWSAISGFAKAAAGAETTLAQYAASRVRDQNVLLIFDQFEEVLRVDPLDVEVKRAFFMQLGDLLTDPTIWALFVLREDYLAPLDPYAALVPTHLQNRYRLDRLTRAMAMEAIERPTRETERKYAAGVVQTLVDNLATVTVQQLVGPAKEVVGDYVEPLQLQVVCFDVWERMPAGAVLIEASDLGDISNALRSYYDNAVAATAGGDLETERDIRQWFQTQLITADGARNQVRHEAVRSGGLDTQLVQTLLDTYLVRAEPRAGVTWYELAHDRLVPPVRDSNRDWLESHLNKLQKAAALWIAEGKKPALLLLGAELDAACREAASAKLHPDEQDFLEASRAEQESLDEKKRAAEHERVQAKRIRGWLVAAVCGIVAAVGFAVFGWLQYLEASSQRTLAEMNAQMASDNADTLRQEIDKEKGLTQEANDLSNQATLSAKAAVTSSVQAKQNLIRLFQEKADHSLATADAEGSASDYQNAWIYSLATMTNADSDPEAAGILLIPEVQPGYKAAAPTAPCTPRQMHIETAAFAGTNLLCSANNLAGTANSTYFMNGREVVSGIAGIRSLAGDAAMEHVVMGVGNGQLVDRGSKGVDWGGFSKSPFTAVALLSDAGKIYLAAGTDIGNLGIRQPQGQRAPPKEAGDVPPEAIRVCAAANGVCPGVQSLAWKPGSDHTLAVGLADGTIHFFRLTRSGDTTAPSPLRTLAAAGSGVTALAFWPGTAMLISGHSDGRVRVWDTDAGTQLASAIKHEEAVIGAQIDAQGKEITSISKDGEILKTGLRPQWFGRAWDMQKLLHSKDARVELYAVSRRELGFDPAKSEPTPLANSSVLALKYFNFGATEHFTNDEAAKGKLLLRAKFPMGLKFPTMDKDGTSDLIHLMPDQVEGSRSAAILPLDLKTGFKAEFYYRVSNRAQTPANKIGDGFTFFFYKDTDPYQTAAQTGSMDKAEIGFIPGSGYGVTFNLYSVIGRLIGIFGPAPAKVFPAYPSLLTYTGVMEKGKPVTLASPTPSNIYTAAGPNSVCVEVLPVPATSLCAPTSAQSALTGQPIQGVSVYLNNIPVLGWRGVLSAASGGIGFAASTGEAVLGVDVGGIRITPAGATAPLKINPGDIKLISAGDGVNQATKPLYPVFEGNEMVLTPDSLYQAGAVFLDPSVPLPNEFSVEFEYSMSSKSSDPYSTGSGLVLMADKDLKPYQTRVLPEGEARAFIPGSGFGVHLITNQRRAIELRDGLDKVIATHAQPDVFTGGDWRKVRVEVDGDSQPTHVKVYFQDIRVIDAAVSTFPGFHGLGFGASTGILHGSGGQARQSVRNVVVRDLSKKGRSHTSAR